MFEEGSNVITIRAISERIMMCAGSTVIELTVAEAQAVVSALNASRGEVLAGHSVSADFKTFLRTVHPTHAA